MTSSSPLRVGCAGGNGADFVVRIEGRGTLQESPAFKAFAVELLDDHPSAMLTVELERCEYLDSTFLGCLVSLGRRYAQGHSKRFVIAATPATRARLLAPTRLDRVLPLVDVFPPEPPAWAEIPIEIPTAHDLGWHIMECHEELVETDAPQAPAFRAIVERLSHELRK
jgi:anti-anti-sigma factor